MNRINRRLILLALPFVLGFLAFYLIPLISAIRYSLLENAFTKQFVGLGNYVATLSNPYFRLSVRNTLALILLGVPSLVAGALFLALLMKDRAEDLSLLRAALILPMLLPSTAIANAFAKLPFENPRVALLAVYAWKNAGFLMLIFLAAFSMIPKELYEAAALDGAKKTHAFFSITLPSILGTLLFAIVLAISYNLRLFREAFLLYGAYPKTTVYLTQHYMNNHFYKLNYQKLTTASTVFTLVLFSCVWIGLRLIRRYAGERD